MPREEFQFIDRIRAKVVDRPPVVLGIGDDAAILQLDANRETLVAADMLIDGVHFRLDEIEPELAGRKALAVNLSDIAAMGGEPQAAFVTVALPRARGMMFADRVMGGLLDLADEFGVVVAGGDTNVVDGPFVISVTVTGQSWRRRAVRRSGAQPGDWLLASGEFGGSLAGRHLTFTPRVQLMQSILDRADVHAAIDVSDGLAADLHHILKASGVGAVVEAESIPMSQAARLRAASSTTDTASLWEEPLGRALSDGEDFELLLAVDPDAGARLIADRTLTAPLTRIGQFTQHRGCQLRFADGRETALPAIGWTHQFRSP